MWCHSNVQRQSRQWLRGSLFREIKGKISLLDGMDFIIFRQRWLILFILKADAISCKMLYKETDLSGVTMCYIHYICVCQAKVSIELSLSFILINVFFHSCLCALLGYRFIIWLFQQVVLLIWYMFFSLAVDVGLNAYVGRGAKKSRLLLQKDIWDGSHYRNRSQRLMLRVFGCRRSHEISLFQALQLIVLVAFGAVD